MSARLHIRDARLDAAIAAAGIGIALVLSLFFNGVYLQCLALAQCALLLAIAWVVARGYGRGFAIPRSGLPLAVALFWLWLAVSIAWSHAWYLSFLNLWWVGSVLLVFWLGLLTGGAEHWWRWVFGWVLAVVGCLVVYALIQFFAWGQNARATFLDRNSFAALLNLVSLPLAATLVIPPKAAEPGQEGAWSWRRLGHWLRPVGWALLFCMLLVVALTKSRGALLSLGVGLALVLFVSWRSYRWRRAAIILTLFAAALVAANLQWHGIVLERLAGLVHPASAGATRFVIWERAWSLLKQHPFAGIGLGTFWLAYPPFRAPGDTSAGFYVHNDYLQLWIEVGLPGLLLWLAMMAAAIRQFVRLLRAPQATTDQRMLGTGVFAGLTAIALHSLFTFNLYLLPIDIVAGALLARLQGLAVLGGATRCFELVPARRMTGRGYRTLVILIVAIPLANFGGLTEAMHLVETARADLQARDLVAANAAFNRAEIMAPGVDTTWYAHADMLVRSTRLLAGKEHTKQRRDLYELALKKLARAQALNSLRPQVYMVRGDLFAQNPDLAGPHAIRRAEAQYRKAIARDPRYLDARYALAHLLVRSGKAKQAATVLVAGLNYWQPYSPFNARYVKYTARVLGATGDAEARTMVLRRFADWLQATHEPSGSTRQAPRPVHGVEKGTAK